MSTTLERTIAAVWLACGVAAAPSALAQQPIRIGYAADMSGACGPLVDSATKAFRMGVEDLNKAGGLLGRRIEVIERDTKTQPAEGAKEVRDLIVNHKVDLVTGVCSSAVWLAESAVAAEFKVPLYSAIAATQTGTIEKWHPYTWQTGANTLMESAGAAEYLAANKAWKKVVPVAYDYEWGHTSVKAFSDHLKRLRPDIEIAPMIPIKLGETNMTAYITAALAQKPDVVFGAVFGGGLINLVKQGQSMGFFQQTNLLTLATVDFQQSMGAQMPDKGVHGFARAPFNALLGNPKAKAFIDAYRARHGKDADDWAILAYDGLMFYAEVVRQARSVAADDVVKALTQVNYDGLRARNLKVRALDHQMNAPEWVGPVARTPQYPYSVITGAVLVDGDRTMPTEAEVKARRAAAK